MKPILRRSLFWRVYLTLLISLVLTAVLGALLGIAAMHALGDAPIRAGAHMRPRFGPPGRHFLVVLLTVAAAVGCAAYPVVSRITRRLEALRRGVEAWGGGDLARRAPVDGADEIAAVAASFNAAADRAATLLAAHKTLLAHASHELRSPLTRLRVATEMFVSAPDPALLPAISQDIAELDGLVDEILLASRLDHGQDAEGRERVDCLALVAEEAARAGVGVAAVEPGSPAFEVWGAPRLLRRMIRNLIDNARKHGAPPIEVALARATMAEGPRVTIAVRDHGPGIAEHLREQVFEPFYRPEGWAEDAGGWGLGLSLVRQIVRRHGGEVWCDSTVGGMTTFAVSLPVQAA